MFVFLKPSERTAHCGDDLGIINVGGGAVGGGRSWWEGGRMSWVGVKLHFRCMGCGKEVHALRWWYNLLLLSD